MRILILTATYSPSINGVAISVATQKDQLESKGHEVYVIAPKHPKSKPEKDVYLLPSLPNPLEPDYPIFLPVLNGDILKILPKKPDIIYFQHPFIVGNIALLMAKIYKCPTVFYYHTQYELYSKIYTKKLIPSDWAVKITRTFLREILNKTDHIIVGSQTFADQLKKDKIHTPYSIIPITRSLPVKTNKQETSNNIILCVSRIAKEKNLEVLFKAFKKLNQENKDWKLIMVGSGPQLEKYRQKYANERIIFTGAVAFEEINKYYSQATIFAFPSKSEVQPGVIFEAMNAGLPIVAFNAPGPKDFTVHNFNSLLAKNNFEFEKYLKSLLEDDEKRKVLSGNSFKQGKKYLLSESIKEIDLLFKRLTRGAKISTTSR